MRKTIKFSFNIPDKIWRWRPSNIVAFVKYHLSRPRCSCCGTKLWLERGDVEWAKTKWDRLTVSMPWERMICKDCLAKKIRELGEKNYNPVRYRDEYSVTNKCDCCGETKTAYKNFDTPEYGTVRFCHGGAWNWHRICVECAATALENGEVRSSIMIAYDGKYVSSWRGKIPFVNGKPKFPWS